MMGPSARRPGSAVHRNMNFIHRVQTSRQVSRKQTREPWRQSGTDHQRPTHLNEPGSEIKLALDVIENVAHRDY